MSSCWPLAVNLFRKIFSEDNQMKKILMGTAVLLLTVPTILLAGGPDNPGVFGTDRAAWLDENSGKEWGAIAPTRAGDNGTINQDYKAEFGGDPNPESDNGSGNDE
jgi:hypothetical protein